jgi:adenylate cyclase
MTGIFAELKRRKVIRVAIVYGVVGFAIMEAADIMVTALGLPPEFITFVVAAIILGYPIAMVLAWSYDVVPNADVREAENAEIASDKKAGIAKFSPFRIIVTLGIAASVALNWYQMQTRQPVVLHSSAVTYVDSLAVMPLDNLTGDPAFDHLGIGITEEIITHLARIPPLKVISRHSVQAVAAQNLTTPQIANALGVRHVIEGSVRLGGENFIVTLQHINAESDAHIWAETFRGSVENMIGLQEDVARQVTSRVVLMIPGISQPNMTTHVNLGPGQEAYLAGKRWLGQRTPEGLARSIESFTRALQLDPTYAPAYADLASAYALVLSYRYDIGIDGYTLAARSLAMSDRANELDPNLAAGYATRGLLGAMINRPAANVAADFDRAATLQPNAASIPSWRARSLAENGNTEEAFSEARRAVDLDPLAPGRHIAVANISFQLGRFDEAIAAARMATTLEPRLVRGRAIEARSLLLNGEAERCAGMILGPHRVLRAVCLAESGRLAEAQAIVDKVLEDDRKGKAKDEDYSEAITYADLSLYYATRSNAESALFWAAKAYSVSPAGLDIRVIESAFFDPVRDDKNFSSSIAAIRSDLFARVQRDSEQYR